jgi:glycosyltransferase involved in cell wall biosynthesis
MPDVSVVIPTHNRRHLLGQAVRSALGQTDVEIEVLVVDDGSTDGTADAVARFRDDRIQLIRHPRPRGVALARNAGAEAARAAWVALLDDDDLWAPDKLSRQLAAASAADAGWVYAGVVEVDADVRPLGGGPPPSPETLLSGLRRRNLMPAGSSNVVVRSDVLSSSGGFDPGLRHLADWDLWLRLAALGPPACVPVPLVAYRLHPGQATLDTTGMLAEASVLEARHGADRIAILRWAAWSHLRAGHRRAALRSYAGAMLGGDLGSLARAVVALLHPRPATVRRPSHRPAADLTWLAAAQGWLDPSLSLQTQPRRPDVHG